MQAKLDGIKLAAGCADCGLRSDLPIVFDFDHVRGEKTFNIGNGLRDGVGEAALLAELEKCDVVCANCHRVRTHNRNHGITMSAPVICQDRKREGW